VQRLKDRLGARSAPAATAPEPIDFPVEGPEADAALQELVARPTRLRGPILVIRAAQEWVPPWMTIEPEQGWRGRSARVVVRAIPASHVDILREPHVRSLAEAIVALVEPGPRYAESRSSVRSTSSGSM
jgi:thioesterase domain-containing protein